MSRFSDFLRQAKNTLCSVVVVAAGASTRMGEDKLFMDLSGMPVLARTLTALNRCGCVDEIVVVTRLESLEKTAALCREYRITKAGKVIVGGATRTESALAGLVQIRRNAKYVLIHDGARPLITTRDIDRVLNEAAEYGAAIAAAPVTDTIKLCREGVVAATPDRSTLYSAQTPQAFKLELYLSCMDRLGSKAERLTDDSALLELCKVPVRIVPVTACNIKITRPQDLAIAEAVLQSDTEE